jgi:hypothetical protein
MAKRVSKRKDLVLMTSDCSARRCLDDRLIRFRLSEEEPNRERSEQYKLAKVKKVTHDPIKGKSKWRLDHEIGIKKAKSTFGSSSSGKCQLEIG